MRSSSLVLLTMCGLNLLFGQQRPSAPQPEDPELYFAFFRAHSAVDQQMQASAAAVAATLAASTASLYQISPADLPKLTTEVRTFMSDLAAWEIPVRAYVAQQQASKHLPDMKVMVGFQNQRQLLVIATHSRVQQAITPASWSGLTGYIKGPFRSSLSTGGAK
jgi:hypothetical protein